MILPLTRGPAPEAIAGRGDERAPGVPSPGSAALEPGHVLAPEVYEKIRPRYWPAMIERRRTRRLDVGGHVSVLFENRETLLAQVHEQLRAESAWSAASIRAVIAEYAYLLPAPDTVTATLLIDGMPAHRGRSLARRLVSGAPVVYLGLGHRAWGARAEGEDPRVAGAVHFLRFAVDGRLVRALSNPSAAVSLTLRDEDAAAVVPLRAETRRALAADLAAPERASLLETLAAGV